MKKITLLFLLSVSFSFGQVLSEDFEAGLTLPTGWTNNDIAGGGEVWTFATGGQAIGYNPPNTIYYTDGLLTGNYAIFNSDGYGGTGPAEEAALESPAFDCSGLTLIQLSFNHFFTAGYGGQGFVEVYNGSTWIQVASYSGADQDASSFGLEEIDVTSQLTGVTNAKVRFRWVGDYAWGWAVDNVVVEEGPSCLVPTGFVAGTITTTSFEINWDNAATGTPTWDIEWGAEGFTQGSGTTITGLTTPTYNFTPLTADTTYDFYIRTNCGGGDYSEWVGPLSFLTTYDCSTYSLPYNQNFDNGNAFASCYTTEDVDGDTISWISQQDLDLDGDTVPETFATNGNSTANAKNDWLFSPGFSLTANTEYQVGSTFNAFNGSGSLEAFIVDSPSSTAITQIPLFSQTSIPSQTALADLLPTAITETNTFTPTTSGTYYIAYHSFGSASSGFILLFNSNLDSSLGISDYDSNVFKHFYNKDTDNLTLTSSSFAFDNIQLFNLLGQQVLNKNLSQTSETINLATLKDGVYLAKVTIEGRTQTVKILKQ